LAEEVRKKYDTYKATYDSKKEKYAKHEEELEQAAKDESDAQEELETEAATPSNKPTEIKVGKCTTIKHLGSWTANDPAYCLPKVK
jgi:hypothetical protein